MSIAMAIWTQGDAVPDAVALLDTKDVMHVEEARITLCLAAAATLTSACTRKYGAAHLRIALHLGAHDTSPLGTVAADEPRVADRAIVVRVVDKLIVACGYRDRGQINDTGPGPKYVCNLMGVFLAVILQPDRRT